MKIHSATPGGAWCLIVSCAIASHCIRGNCKTINAFLSVRELVNIKQAAVSQVISVLGL